MADTSSGTYRRESGDDLDPTGRDTIDSEFSDVSEVSEFSDASEVSEYSEVSEATDDATLLAERRRTRGTSPDRTVIADEEYRAQAARSAHRYKIAVFVLLGLAGVLTLGAAVRFWLPAWAPLVAFTVLGVGPLFFWAAVGALIFDPSKTKDGLVGKDSPPLALRLKLALVPVAGAALVGAAISALWYLPPVRVLLVEISASQRLSETLDSALRDDSPSVRLAACEGLTELKTDTSSRLLDALLDPDETVVDCALEAIPGQPIAAPQLASTARKWQTELVETPQGRQTGERACMLSNRIRVAERKGLKHAPMQLMSCALDAQSAESRECCSQSFRAILGGNDVEPAMVMGTPVELVHNGYFKSVPSLLEATHSKDSSWERKRLALRLDTPGSRAWAMSLGCASLDLGGAPLRAPISSAMAHAASSETCTIQPAEETTVRLWNAVCAEVFTPQRVASADGTESEQFCKAINGTLVADANNEARQVAHDALRAARQPERQKQMMRMLLDYSGRIAKASMGEGGEGGLAPDQILFGKKNKDGRHSSMMGEMMKMFAEGQGGLGAMQDGLGADPTGAKRKKGSAPADEMLKLFFGDDLPQPPPGFD